MAVLSGERVTEMVTVLHALLDGTIKTLDAEQRQLVRELSQALEAQISTNYLR